MDDLKQRRLASGISQAEIARRVGCSRAYICMVEKGKTKPTIAMEVQIARVLDGNIPTSAPPIPEAERKWWHELWCERHG